MPVTASVPLLDVEPGFGRFLDEDDRAAARALLVPVRSVAKGTTDIAAKLEQAGAFASVVVDGMLMQQLQLGDRTAARLLGPGDIVTAPAAPDPATLDGSRLDAAAPTRLALLGNEVLAAGRRWPGLMAGLHTSSAQQVERLSAQMVICQMPRVDDRLMALLWLLANSWGRVTSSGTTLPLHLTHSTLGALIGARRPTVTLALGELTGRGAILSQDPGWLLVESPPEGRSTKTWKVQAPVLDAQTASLWSDGENRGRAPDEVEELAASYRALRDTVSDLRRRHHIDVNLTRTRLRALRTSREEWEAARRRIQRDRLKLRQTPSS